MDSIESLKDVSEVKVLYLDNKGNIVQPEKAHKRLTTYLNKEGVSLHMSLELRPPLGFHD